MFCIANNLRTVNTTRWWRSPLRERWLTEGCTTLLSVKLNQPAGLPFH